MMTRYLLIVFTLCLIGSASASDTRYRVEMVFFAQTDEKAFFSEHWPLDEGLAGKASQEETRLKAFDLLAKSTMTLTDAATRLEKSPRYSVLSHIAWEQPGLAEDKAVSMPISGGTDFREEYPGRMESRWETDEAGQMIEIPGPASLNELDGSVKLVLGRYLHLYTDLVYRKPVIVEQLDEETQEVLERRTLFDIPVQSHRKMRSRELHYLDHPMIGILIEVTPVETADKPS
jgi:hypothetical protein